MGLSANAYGPRRLTYTGGLCLQWLFKDWSGPSVTQTIIQEPIYPWANLLFFFFYSLQEGTLHSLQDPYTIPIDVPASGYLCICFLYT